MISQLVSLDERAGTNVSAYKDIDDVLGAAGLNFNVETVPAHDPEGREVPGVNLIRREDSGTILGTCGNRYQVIDNRDMFKPFASVVEDHGASYESAGTVGDGRVNWISAKLPEDLTINVGKVPREAKFHDWTCGGSRSMCASWNPAATSTAARRRGSTAR